MDIIYSELQQNNVNITCVTNSIAGVRSVVSNLPNEIFRVRIYEKTQCRGLCKHDVKMQDHML